ncbi:MAG: hypothetical protein FJ216_02330 [Ignavibacteria bacterium]|nr:hypothetical protein [Ignavibacteria bacterium]
MIPIPIFPDYYAHTDGRIYQIKKETRRKSIIGSNLKYRQVNQYLPSYSKYLCVSIKTAAHSYTFVPVHRLIANAYYKIDPSEYTISHADGNVFNNRPSNLKFKRKPKLFTTTENQNIKYSEIPELEQIFKNHINYDCNNPYWKKYKKIKNTNRFRPTYNWLLIYLKSNKLL